MSSNIGHGLFEFIEAKLLEASISLQHREQASDSSSSSDGGKGSTFIFETAIAATASAATTTSTADMATASVETDEGVCSKCKRSLLLLLPGQATRLPVEESEDVALAGSRFEEFLRLKKEVKNLKMQVWMQHDFCCTLSIEF